MIYSNSPKSLTSLVKEEKHTEAESVGSAKPNAVLLSAAACHVHLKLLDLWFLAIETNLITYKLRQLFV